MCPTLLAITPARPSGAQRAGHVPLIRKPEVLLIIILLQLIINYYYIYTLKKISIESRKYWSKYGHYNILFS